jgi:hypothetical protein
MFVIVMVAAAAIAVGLPVAVAVPDFWSCVEVLDPPHAVANAATRHMAAQNKPNLFILTLSIGPCERHDYRSELVHIWPISGLVGRTRL